MNHADACTDSNLSPISEEEYELAFQQLCEEEEQADLFRTVITTEMAHEIADCLYTLSASVCRDRILISRSHIRSRYYPGCGESFDWYYSSDHSLIPDGRRTIHCGSPQLKGVRRYDERETGDADGFARGKHPLRH